VENAEVAALPIARVGCVRPGRCDHDPALHRFAGLLADQATEENRAYAKMKLDSEAERFYRECCSYVNHDISKAQMRYLLKCFKFTFGHTPTFQAVQKLLLGGAHPSSCVYDLPDGACSRHVATYNDRRNFVIRLLQSPGAGILSENE